ncbi:MAG: LytTR family DNA-binding domain-containing protein [Eubacteriales bacterium]|nr:LytTR family DNA-binding domain-containing protein [Eubacteriales bacterium]
MHSNQPISIRLMIDRQERTIMTNTILYAQVTDKLCKISLTDQKQVKLFMSISSLRDMLPDEGFLEISRSCLVSLQYIRTIDGPDVVMVNGVRLPYSIRRRTTILHAFQKHLAFQASQRDSYEWKLDLAMEFRCFDHCPIPFCILESVSNPLANSIDFIFRYANEAFASLQHQPLNRLINSTFSSKFPAAAGRWLPVFSRIAFQGGTADIVDTLNTPLKEMHVTCYQPHYGFCACLMVKPSFHSKPQLSGPDFK